MMDMGSPCSLPLPALLPAGACTAVMRCQPCLLQAGQVQACTAPQLIGHRHALLFFSASPAACCQGLVSPLWSPCCLFAQASFLYLQGWRLDPILLFGQLLVVGAAVTFAVEAIRLRSIVYGKVGPTAGLERLSSVASSSS